jgi:hypothetical protein
VSVNRCDTVLHEQVIKTLLYFDIFNYPLRPSEVLKFLRCENSAAQVTRSLNELVEKKYIFKFGDLYSLQPEENNITRRLRGNAAAEKWLTVAKKKASFIGKFPYVRAVMASGSLSKGYMDEKSDLDFFVVTAPGRLWIARTLLVMYKRLFLRNSHKQFCVNYFVDEQHLEIEEKNLFTATELVTLLPLYNHEAYCAVITTNSWVSNFFPNFRYPPADRPDAGHLSITKNVIELLITPASRLLDKSFMWVSLQRWNRIYGKQYSKQDFEIAFKTRRYVSKNHPSHYQKKILGLYECKLAEFKTRLGQLTIHE